MRFAPKEPVKLDPPQDHKFTKAELAKYDGNCLLDYCSYHLVCLSTNIYFFFYTRYTKPENVCRSQRYSL